MFNFKKGSAENPSVASKALVHQDSRTSVKTATAQTETTNTTEKNALIFNSERNTLTVQTTRQTTVHQQKAHVTEIVRRVTPTEQELEDLLRKLNMNKAEASAKRRSGNFTAGTSKAQTTGAGGAGAAYSSGGILGGISTKSTPKFKSSISPVTRLSFNYEPNTAGTSYRPSGVPTTPTVGRWQEETVSQRDGRNVTSRTETQAVKLNTAHNPYYSATNPSFAQNVKNKRSGADNDDKLVVVKANADMGSCIGKYKGNTNTHTNANTNTNGAQMALQLSSASLSPARTAVGSPVGARGGSEVTSTNKNNNSMHTLLPSYKLSSPNSPLTKRYDPPSSYKTASTNASKVDAKAFFSTGAPTTVATYTSPYSRLTLSTSTTSSGSPFTREFGAIPSASNSASAIVSVPSTPIRKTKSKLLPGRCYILNHERFEKSKEMRREGSAADVHRLRETFEHFRLKVTIQNDRKVDEVKSLVNKLKTRDYSQRSCLVIAILSHGERNDMVWASDGMYSIQDDVIIPILTNSTLTKKPKIIIVQACKGTMKAGKMKSDAHEVSNAPSEILKCYSTYEGYLSYRDEKEGTVFISTFCECLRRGGTEKDIMEIMKEVTRLVSERTRKYNLQIPSITSTMTNEYKFGDYV